MTSFNRMRLSIENCQRTLRSTPRELERRQLRSDYAGTYLPKSVSDTAHDHVGADVVPVRLQPAKRKRDTAQIQDCLGDKSRILLSGGTKSRPSSRKLSRCIDPWRLLQR